MKEEDECYVYLLFVCLRGLESGLKCSDLLTKFTGLTADEEANRLVVLFKMTSDLILDREHHHHQSHKINVV